MASGIKVSGTYRSFGPFVKVSGVWKAATGFVKVAGAWKQWTASGGGSGPCTIGGSLSVSTAIPNPISTAQVVTVALGNTGRIQVKNLSVGSGDLQIRVDAGSYVTQAGNDITTFVSGQTIQCRGLAMTADTTITFNLYDVDTNTLIQSVTIQRIS